MVPGPQAWVVVSARDLYGDVQIYVRSQDAILEDQ